METLIPVQVSCDSSWRLSRLLGTRLSDVATSRSFLLDDNKVFISFAYFFVSLLSQLIWPVFLLAVDLLAAIFIHQSGLLG